MQSTFPTQQAEQDFYLLQSYLTTNVYQKPVLLLESDTEELICYVFRQYYVFLSFDPETWYSMFRDEIYKLLAVRHLSNDEAELHLRSSNFVRFAQRLMAELKNETNPVTPPPARSSGEDLSHVCA